jgi:hypothetical protein
LTASAVNSTIKFTIATAITIFAASIFFPF